MIITGNIFSGLNTKAIQQTGKQPSRRVRVSGNVVTEVEGEATKE